MGPEISVGASAVTHESSSGAASVDDVAVVSALDEGASGSASSATRLRFLTFLSPLNESGLTMF